MTLIFKIIPVLQTFSNNFLLPVLKHLSFLLLVLLFLIGGINKYIIFRCFELFEYVVKIHSN